MRLTPFAIVLFFVAVNVSLSVIQLTQVLPPDEQISPYSQPTDITAMLVHLDISTENLVIGGSTIAVMLIIGWFTGHMILGGTLAIVLFALDLFIPVGKWVIFGIPSFVSTMVGVASADAATALMLNGIVAGLTALLSVVWFWFILGFFTGRPTGDDI